MKITTTEEVYEDGNRATTIFNDGVPILIVTMGDDEDPEDYWQQYVTALTEIEAAENAESEPDEGLSETDDA